MSGGGSKKGERRGGRKLGTPNKATVETVEEQAHEAKLIAEAAKRAGRKLGKELLDDFAQLFAGMAAYYQPTPAGAAQTNQHANEAKFFTYAELAVKCAKELAKYQSPQFRAVMVAPAPPPKDREKVFTLKMFDETGRPAPKSAKAVVPSVKH